MSAERYVYEPPFARDLSELNVAGQGEGQGREEGICRSGAKPYTQCLAGPNPTGGTCTPSGTGVLEDPACTSGSTALIGCTRGSAAP
jgi:hypothetical protein